MLRNARCLLRVLQEADLALLVWDIQLLRPAPRKSKLYQLRALRSAA